MLMDIQHTKLGLMPPKSKEDLADYVRRIRQEKGLSVQEVENIARRAGHKISRSYVSQIENRYILSVTAAKLQALAKGLGVPEDEVFAVARGKNPAEESDFKKWKFASLFDEAEQLSPEQMAKFEIIMEMARREVQRMLQEQEQKQEQESPRKARRMPDVVKAVDASQGKAKKRA